jgi:hypothetical protein
MQRREYMPQAVNVILYIDDEQYNLNKMGLVSMKFERFLAGNTSSIASNVLSELEIAMFDKTGSDLIAILQRNQNNIKVSYGFENESMSPVYNLNIIKFKTTYNNLGAMVVIGAIGSEINRKFPSEVFAPKTKIIDILKSLAQRNNWYIGGIGSKEYIDIDERIELTQFILKEQNETDYDFIVNKIVPLINQTVIELSSRRKFQLFNVQLADINGRVSLIFKKLTSKGSERRVWKYEYGSSANNAIISLTNSVDMSFLVRGLTIQVPLTATDFLQSDEDIQKRVKNILDNNIEFIDNLITEYGLPIINYNNFLFNVEAVSAENIGNISEEQIILEKLRQVMNSINTMELEVIGNPSIMTTDLIDLTIKNKNGDLNILSSSSAIGSFWRVIGIEEVIGLNGYSTRLQLVRDITVII